MIFVEILTISTKKNQKILMVTKGIIVVKLVAWTLPYIVWLTLLMGGFAALYHYDYIEFSIPLFSSAQYKGMNNKKRK